MEKSLYIHYVYLLTKNSNIDFTEELIRAHVHYLKELDQRGQLVLCGPFTDYPGGMVVIRADSYKDAKQIAENDPFISSGAESYELRTLEASCEQNNHLGMG